MNEGGITMRRRRPFWTAAFFDTTQRRCVLWKSEDFSYDKETDDLYSMEVRANDLAGNQSNVKILFSVNRFGSVYTFDTQTEKLIGKNGKYYNNREQTLVITETNVDTLEFKEITMNFNCGLPFAINDFPSLLTGYSITGNILLIFA